MMDRWNVSIEPAIEKEETTIPAHKVLKVIEELFNEIFLCCWWIICIQIEIKSS